ncbi:hypothetical protein GOE08_06885 [Sinorhizobium medicae]|nr:hypothetical protein [Sinorhizobium medicae]MDX1006611.1 hypothetical protein [Sinorhizobium medicae]
MTKKPRQGPRGSGAPSGADESESLTFGSALDDIGFQPIGRRSVLGRGRNIGKTVSISHPPPRSVHYDTRSGMIVVEFVNDAVFTAPARALKGLIDATENEIAEVELQDKTHLHWKRRDTSHEIAMLVSGNFGTQDSEGDFVECPAEAREDHRTSVPPWVAPVIKLISDNLPGNSKTGWYHEFLTAYQIGCETLVALGQAEDTTDGATPRVNPTLPAILPRRDDVAVAVIFLAAQNGLITFLSPGEDEPKHLIGKGFESLHQSADNKWAACSHPEVTNILRLLGVLDGVEWTEAAETVLWRDSPNEWRIDFTNNPRFIKAVNDACNRMPDRIRDAIERFSRITDEDIAVYTSGSSREDKEDCKSVIRLRPQTREQAISTILWIRRFDFDELFYKFWRIDDGWLSPDEARRALEIFHDPLAIAVRKRVAVRLYPHFPHLAE